MDDYTVPPIVVNESPTRAQVEAGLRQFIMGCGPVLTLLASTGWGQRLHLADWATDGLGCVGVASTVIVFVWGQIATRTAAKKSAAMANMLPDTKAQTK